ncbi:MAG TPA: hypothetical protein VI078_15595 [bacterium]
MRKLGLVFLAAALLVGLAACHSGKSERYDPVGTWELVYSWNQGQVHMMEWRIFGNNTFLSSTGSGGTWTSDGEVVTLAAADGTAYRGVFVNHSAISGTMSSSHGTGTWDAGRTSWAP